MATIKVNNDIIYLGFYPRIQVLPTKIIFYDSESSWNCFCYNKGVEITNEQFDTLTTFLANQENNPCTVI